MFGAPAVLFWRMRGSRAIFSICTLTMGPRAWAKSTMTALLTSRKSARSCFDGTVCSPPASGKRQVGRWSNFPANGSCLENKQGRNRYALSQCFDRETSQHPSAHLLHLPLADQRHLPPTRAYHRQGTPQRRGGHHGRLAPGRIWARLRGSQLQGGNIGLTPFFSS